jgi:hypothetical protein
MSTTTREAAATSLRRRGLTKMRAPTPIETMPAINCRCSCPVQAGSAAPMQDSSQRSARNAALEDGALMLMNDNGFSYVKNRGLRELLASRDIRHLTTQP